MNAQLRKLVKFPLDFSLFTFGEPKTRQGNVFFGLKSHLKKGPKVLSAVSTAPII